MAWGLYVTIFIAMSFGIANVLLMAIFERVREIAPDGITAVVDYAHTPDALDNVLKTIDTFRAGDTQVITVVGCGGNRDKTKRPVMARVAAQWSDRVFLTSDNPRSEDPLEIIAQVREGMPGVARVEPDRRKAIGLAIASAAPGDIVLLAGKGHERTQTIGSEVLDLDDFEVASEALRTREVGA